VQQGPPDLAFDELPPAFARPPAMWIPWPVKQRVAETFIVLMERALDAASTGGEAEVRAHQLLKVSGQLLLRVDACADDAIAYGPGR
jgi:hypothetical protein